MLTPVIVIAAVIAVVAIPVLAVGRGAAAGRLQPRRSNPQMAPVLQLEPTSAESSLAVAARRAA